MALSTNVLNYQDNVNKSVIKLYTSLDDIYTGKGLPIEYKGNLLYAPLAPLTAVYATPIRASDDSGDYAIAYDTVGTTQDYYSNKVTEISLSGNRTQEKTHDAFTFVAPKSGKYHLKVRFRGGQNGWGYSGDKWQYANFYLDLDTDNIKVLEVRRSWGMGWKTLFDDDIEVDGGTHILTMRMFGKSSSKDSHLTACYEWESKITMIEEG
jgi:hypothetical protein